MSAYDENHHPGRREKDRERDTTQAARQTNIRFARGSITVERGAVTLESGAVSAGGQLVICIGTCAGSEAQPQPDAILPSDPNE